MSNFRPFGAYKEHGASCLSVVGPLCSAPSPCYALLNTSVCTPLASCLCCACRHASIHILGKLLGGEKKPLNITSLAGLSRDWVGVNKWFVCFCFNSFPCGEEENRQTKSSESPWTILGKSCLCVSVVRWFSCSLVALGMTPGVSFHFPLHAFLSWC